MDPHFYTYASSRLSILDIWLPYCLEKELEIHVTGHSEHLGLSFEKIW